MIDLTQDPQTRPKTQKLSQIEVEDFACNGQAQTVWDGQPLLNRVFVFRGRRGDIVKVLGFDGDGLCNPPTENP